MATSLVGCCTGATGDNYISAITGIMAMGIAGEIAQQSLTPTEGAGTFRMRLFDVMSNMSPDTVRWYGNIN
jgi:hydroxyethylthiazole kinase